MAFPDEATCFARSRAASDRLQRLELSSWRSCRRMAPDATWRGDRPHVRTEEERRGTEEGATRDGERKSATKGARDRAWTPDLGVAAKGGPRPSVPRRGICVYVLKAHISPERLSRLGLPRPPCADPTVEPLPGSWSVARRSVQPYSRQSVPSSLPSSVETRESRVSRVESTPRVTPITPSPRPSPRRETESARGRNPICPRRERDIERYSRTAVK